MNRGEATPGWQIALVWIIGLLAIASDVYRCVECFRYGHCETYHLAGGPPPPF